MWGEQRTTDDESGGVLYTRKIPLPTDQSIKRILCQFVGPILQVPPFYSSVKVSGYRASNLSRRGKNINLKPRVIEIFSLRLLLTENCRRRAQFEVICSPGTYIRSIARDIGRRLGCYGYASYINRLFSGCFFQGQAIKFNELKTFDKSTIESHLIKVQKALGYILSFIITRKNEESLRNGQAILLPSKLLQFSIIHNGCVVLCSSYGLRGAPFYLLRLKDRMLYPECLLD